MHIDSTIDPPYEGLENRNVAWEKKSGKRRWGDLYDSRQKINAVAGSINLPWSLSILDCRLVYRRRCFIIWVIYWPLSPSWAEIYQLSDTPRVRRSRTLTYSWITSIKYWTSGLVHRSLWFLFSTHALTAHVRHPSQWRHGQRQSSWYGFRLLAGMSWRHVVSSKLYQR